MRLISFALTTPQVQAKEKTVTRRNGWKAAKAGMHLMPVNKVMGFTGRWKGQKPQRLFTDKHIVIVNERWEPLEAITPEDVIREGFAGWTTEQFISFYTKHNKCDRYTLVHRIEFIYVEDRILFAA